MIFFFFSFLASLFGSIQASRHYDYAFTIHLSIDNPFAGIIAFWPFIVALVLLLLAILWYQTIKSIQRRKTQKGTRQRTGSQNTVFLGIVTVLVLVLLAAPWYLETFDKKEAAETEIISAEDRVEVILTVHGMDCSGCEGLVNRRVGNLEGVESVVSSHMREEVVVVYDQQKTNLGLIAQTIEDSGYTVVLE